MSLEKDGKSGKHGNHGRNERDSGKNADNGPAESSKHSSHVSHSSHKSQNLVTQSTNRIIPPRGDYRKLLSYQKADVIYQITYRFCHRFLSRGDRTIDQMIQAARSGKQNIVEGSKAGTTSKESEIKLTNVARASLEELLEDYRDFLKARNHKIWEKNSREAIYVRDLGKSNSLTFAQFSDFIETRSEEVVANIAICLIHQTNYLLDHQLAALEDRFLEEGGLRERMTRARLQSRKNKP